MSGLSIGRIASAYLPQGAGAGVHATKISGADAISDGSGGWVITLLPPYDAIADEEVELTFAGAPGSDPGGQGISFGVGSGGPGAYALNIYRNDTGAKVSVPVYFTANLRQ